MELENAIAILRLNQIRRIIIATFREDLIFSRGCCCVFYLTETYGVSTIAEMAETLILSFYCVKPLHRKAFSLLERAIMRVRRGQNSYCVFSAPETRSGQRLSQAGGTDNLQSE